MAKRKKQERQAALFAQVVGALRDGKLRWIEERGRDGWVRFDEARLRWVPDGGVARRTATEIALRNEPYRSPRTFVTDSLQWAMDDDSIRASIHDFDSIDRELGTPSGVIDLGTCSGKSTAVPWLLMKQTRATPDCNARGPWHQALAEWLPDEGTRQWLQLWAGSVLHGSTAQHCLLFIHGPGGSGKSTFSEVFQHALGDYAKVLSSALLIGRTGSDNQYLRASLKGVRLAVFNETGEGEYWNAPEAKSLTGGDTVHAREPYGKPFAFPATHKVLCVSNDPPNLSKVDEAIRRRFAIIEFNARHDKVDRGLRERLEAAAPEVLGWALEGLVALQEQFDGQLMDQRPEGILAATEDYFDDVDLLGEWIAERCSIEPGYRTSFQPIYDSYRDYCDAVGRSPKSWQSLRKELVNRKVIQVVRTKSARWVENLRVNPDLMTDMASPRHHRRW
jgi:putative DNA primase/helicase